MVSQGVAVARAASDQTRVMPISTRTLRRTRPALLVASTLAIACSTNVAPPVESDSEIARSQLNASTFADDSPLNCPRDELGYTKLDVGEVELNVACRGDGPVIVLLHGYPCFHLSWHKYVEPLVREGFRVVAPDQRGYNLSDKPYAVEAYHLDRLSADIDGLISATGKERVLLVGYDWGGVVGWVYGHQHPEKLRGLMLMAAPHPDTWYRPEVDPVQAQAADSYIPLFAGPLGELIFPLYDLYIGPYLSAAELAQYHAAWDQPRAKVSMNNWYRANVYPELKTPRGVVVEVPTLTLWGDRDDLVTSSQIQYLSAYVRDLHVVRLDSDHWFPLSTPDRVIQEILQFERALAP